MAERGVGETLVSSLKFRGQSRLQVASCGLPAVGYSILILNLDTPYSMLDSLIPERIIHNCANKILKDILILICKAISFHTNLTDIKKNF
jgi:hypothetical protein